MTLSLRRLSHGAPSPASAAWIAAKCPRLVELRAEGCTQLTPESLQGFSQAALEVRLPPRQECKSLTAGAMVWAALPTGRSLKQDFTFHWHILVHHLNVQQIDAAA